MPIFYGEVKLFARLIYLRQASHACQYLDIHWWRKGVHDMMKGAKKQKRGGKGIAIGVGISLGLTILLTAFLSTLTDRQLVPYSVAVKFPLGIVLICTLTGAFIGGKIAGEKRMLICLFTGSGYLLTLLAITAFFFRGQFQDILVTAAVVLGSSAVAGVLSASGGRKRKLTKYKIG